MKTETITQNRFDVELVITDLATTSTGARPAQNGDIERALVKGGQEALAAARMRLAERQKRVEEAKKAAIIARAEYDLD